jgi:putative tryptophan/tyrosine transport system substrate-binding protein
MTKTSRTAFLWFPSDNRKSAIENPKWLGLAVIVFVFVMAGAVARAQQPKKIPRIGFLAAGSAPVAAARLDAFRQGLRTLGYIEGKDIVIEYRNAAGKLDQVPRNAAELIHLKVDIIVTAGSNDTRAAKHATTTIPIVMTADNDPVGNGFVASLARPGGNVTGLSSFSTELNGKRLELLKEIIPTLSRVAVFGTSTNPGHLQALRDTETVAGALGLKFLYLDILTPEDVETAFQAARKGRADAVLMLSSPVLTQRKQIAERAMQSRLPAMYSRGEDVEAGGLMSYGVSFADLDRRAATYVDKILKGTKPAELPVEQPTKFEFVINLKAAKQIGLTIPPNVLARADKVIR